MADHPDLDPTSRVRVDRLPCRRCAGTGWMLPPPAVTVAEPERRFPPCPACAGTGWVLTRLPPPEPPPRRTRRYRLCYACGDQRCQCLGAHHRHCPTCPHCQGSGLIPEEAPHA